MNFVSDRIREIDGLQCSKSQGAFYLFPEISSFLGKSNGRFKIKNAIELCQYLLEEYKVALVPGDAFGSNNHIRISFATSIENLEKAMDRIQTGLQNLMITRSQALPLQMLPQLWEGPESSRYGLQTG